MHSFSYNTKWKNVSFSTVQYNNMIASKSARNFYACLTCVSWSGWSFLDVPWDATSSAGVLLESTMGLSKQEVLISAGSSIFCNATQLNVSATKRETTSYSNSITHKAQFLLI